ncbi:hypothetical protein GLOIN_2v1869068 [Rhizophagus clarus]|uniref:Uncharacterized protein n=1 Tax=Rhizophagus clarus TaxID=94130 RepID=A0A8H3LEJ9_9GLOM|nr:hypothetical protein GLOIN_2v1869068 [Rhizophagus clarus]
MEQLSSQKVAQQLQHEKNNNVSTIENIGNISRVKKENKLHSPKTSNRSPYQIKDMDSEQTSMVKPSSHVSRILRKRRDHRQLRHVYTYTLNHIRRLPRQNVNDPYANQIFNGSNFY